MTNVKLPDRGLYYHYDLLLALVTSYVGHRWASWKCPSHWPLWEMTHHQVSHVYHALWNACVATTLQINLEALGMSECHCTFETLGESVQHFVANIMLKGWKIYCTVDISCLLVSPQHTVKWTTFKRAMYILIVWEKFDTKLF